MDIELRHKIFAILKKEPDISQRELSEQLGVSLGKTNYCLNALIQKGWIKVRNFKNSKNKRSYAYYLTGSGMAEKARLTVNFLRMKREEYDALKGAIQELESELEEMKEAEQDSALQSEGAMAQL